LAEPGRVALSSRQDAVAALGAAPATVFTEMEVDLLPTAAPVPEAGAMPSSAAASVGRAPANDPAKQPAKPAVDPFALPVENVVEPLPVPAFLDLVLSGLFSSGTGEEAMPVLRRWDRTASDTLVHVVGQRATDCDDTLARFRHSVMRPFDETAQRPPPHLVEAEKKIADHCAKLASQRAPSRAAAPR